jgi:hypothetical protein
MRMHLWGMLGGQQFLYGGEVWVMMVMGGGGSGVVPRMGVMGLMGLMGRNRSRSRRLVLDDAWWPTQKA